MAKSNNIKVSIDIQIDLLDTIISYLFTESPHINRKTMLNIRNFFNSLETKEYETNEEMFARIYFIREVLKIKLEDNIFNRTMIYEMIRGGAHDEEIENIIDAIENGYELSSEEVRGINNYISERLKYMHLYVYSEEITDQMERLQIGNFESLHEINSEVKETIGNLLSDMRKAESDDMSQNMFDLNDDVFETVITDVVTDLQRPSNYLKTGIKYLNQMYNGGYEAGRVYMYIGPSGGFKSGVLLSSMRWIREYNKDVETKDPNKKPCVLYITQENSMKETIERLFNLYVGPEDIRNYTPQQVMGLLRGKGGLDLDLNEIQLKMFYYPNKSISTDDLYGIIDEVEEEGLEVIALIHDYIKRIRPANPTKDLRIDLANIVDEFTVLAKIKNIPVISATQLNRDAIKIIESAIDSGQSDIAKKLGSSQVGESWAMIENVDYATIIFKEYKSSTDTWYLTFKNVKTRAKVSTLSYFAHPFEKDNQMKLIDDIEMKKPLSVENISEQVATSENLGQRGRTQGRNRKQVDLTEVDEVKEMREPNATDLEDDMEEL